MDANHTVFVLINHGSVTAHVALPSAMSDVLQANRRVASLDLEPQGVAVLESDAR
jgi:hypothetical protein